MEEGTAKEMHLDTAKKFAPTDSEDLQVMYERKGHRNSKQPTSFASELHFDMHPSSETAHDFTLKPRRTGKSRHGPTPFAEHYDEKNDYPQPADAVDTADFIFPKESWKSRGQESKHHKSTRDPFQSDHVWQELKQEANPKLSADVILSGFRRVWKDENPNHDDEVPV